ncbi:HBS1-like protein [Chlorella vulgaris]
MADADADADAARLEQLRGLAELEMRRRLPSAQDQDGSSDGPVAKRQKTMSSVGGETGGGRFDYAATQQLSSGLTGFLLTENSARKEAVPLLSDYLKSCCVEGEQGSPTELVAVKLGCQGVVAFKLAAHDASLPGGNVASASQTTQATAALLADIASRKQPRLQHVSRVIPVHTTTGDGWAFPGSPGLPEATHTEGPPAVAGGEQAKPAGDSTGTSVSPRRVAFAVSVKNRLLQEAAAHPAASGAPAAATAAPAAPAVPDAVPQSAPGYEPASSEALAAKGSAAAAAAGVSGPAAVAAAPIAPTDASPAPMGAGAAAAEATLSVGASSTAKPPDRGAIISSLAQGFEVALQQHDLQGAVDLRAPDFLLLVEVLPAGGALYAALCALPAALCEMKRKLHIKSYWDEDDLDDWEDEDDYEPAPPPPKKPAPAKPKPKAPKLPAAPAAAAAKQPPPQAAQIKQQQHKLVPESAQNLTAAGSVQRFAFDKPSPDDAVLAAQQTTSASSPAAVTAAAAAIGPSRAAVKPHHSLQQQQQQQQAQAPQMQSGAEAAAGLAGGMQGLTVSTQPAQDGVAAAAQLQGVQAAALAGAAPPLARRPLSEYRPDADLAAACKAAAAAEEAGGGAKPRLHLVVLGHVDAGKSTLMGRMLYELGLISDKAVHKTQRDAAASGKGSFAWAWMLDERPEERARGVTVDVATTHFETPARNVTLLDAPGHRDFVPNMIAGAAQADAALLIVDGSPGGFEAGFEPAAPDSLGGGQTREHAQLARSLGVEQVAVVVTKLDTCDFDQQRFHSIRAQLEPFLKTCGFKEVAMQWLPAVGPSGDNLVKPPADPRLAAWWTGATLAQAIDSFQPTDRSTDKPLRLPVSDVSRSGKGGVTVGGKLEGGALRPGSRVLVMPSAQQATVKALEVDGKAVSLARAGDSADVTLAGIDATAVGSGSVLCHPDFPVQLVTRFEAQVVVLDVMVPILRGHQVTIHAHTARESGRISGLVSLLNAKTLEVQRSRPRCLLKGQVADVEVTPSRPMCLEASTDYKALGRVALRDCGRTIAVGKITRLAIADQ